MDHLSTKERHPLYDDWLKWATPSIWEQPIFDVAAYQRRIDQVCGTADGKPIVRLLWAWDKRAREFYFTKWDDCGRGIEGECQYKYRAARIPIDAVDTVDICPPRWILEERYEPGQYAQSWEASRYIYDPVLHRRVDKRGDPPAEWYGFHRVIAEHDPQETCCERRWQERRARCWGYYRLPEDKDLDRLRAAIQRRNADPYKYSPHEPLPPEAMAEIGRAAFAEEEAAEREADRINDDVWRDFVSAHGWRVFEDSKASKRLHHGRFHFMPQQFKQTPSGLLIPNN